MQPRSLEPVTDQLPLREGTHTDTTIEPTHHIAFPGVEYIFAVELSPDGRTAYCLVDGKGINLWAAGLSRWAQGLGAVIVLLILIYLMILARVRRRPQRAGLPHCRRCNYEVVSQAPDAVKRGGERRPPAPGTLCPECGVDLSKSAPIRGRATRRRLLIPTVCLLAAVGWYISLIVRGLPASLNAPGAPAIFSRWVDRAASDYKIAWLLKHEVGVSRIMKVDTATGRIDGTLLTMVAYPQGRMRIAPDGKHVCVFEGIWLRWVSTASGRVQATTEGGDIDTAGPDDSSAVIGFDGPADDPWVYYAAVAPTQKESRLLRWRPRTGEQVVVVTEPSYTFAPTRGGTREVVRRYALLHRADGVATISAPGFLQAYHEKVYTMTVRAPDGTVEREIVVGGNPCSSSIVAAENGSSVFISNRLRGIDGFDTATGASLGMLPVDIPDGPEDRFAIGGDWLIVPVRRSLLVRDMERRRWTARLTYPDPFIAPTVSISADRSWAAAAPFKSMGAGPGGGPYIHELFLYDLSPLKSAAPK